MTIAEISPETFGARGDGSNDAAPIMEWFQTAADQGITAVARLPRTYMVEGEISVNIANNLDVVMSSRATIKGLPGATPVINIRGDEITRPRVVWKGGVIDASLRDHIRGIASGSGLVLTNIDDFDLEGIWFLAGEDYRDNKGDTGLATIRSTGTASKCLFKGWSDAGAYVNGGNDPGRVDDFGDITFSACKFVKCHNALTSKRQARRLIVSNCRFLQCVFGVTAFAASGVAPGRECLLSASIFYKTGKRGVHLRLSKGDVISNNQFIDWGYGLDGVPFPHGDQRAIMLDGTTGSLVTGNVMRLDEWAADTQQGIRLSDSTLDGVVTPATQNSIQSNVFTGLPLGIKETGGADYSTGRGNKMINVQGPVSLPAGSNSNYTA